MIRFLVAALLVIGIPQPALAASAPTGVSIAAPMDPVALGTTVSATGAFTDPDSTTHSATWTWGDGSSSAGQVAHAGDGGTVTGAHGYAQAGVYRVGLDVRDESGASGTAVFEYVVVYDASGGFVTGGGWIDSPPGAYPADPSLLGRAVFGLVAKYKPGASEPDGTTEFQFHAADLNFHSVDYEWLVVAGARAQYKGTGTIQGRSGLFHFIVTTIDGDLLSKGQPDRFRMKILGDSGVVYDNQMGSGDNADPSMVLGGGSIVIHKGKGGPQPVNHAPVANAGADVSVTTGQLVTLDGSGSSDPDGDTLTYAWTIVSAPAGSSATLVGATTVAPTLTPDRAGAYRIQLVVSDGVLFSAPDEVQVNASAPANRAPVAADDQYAATEDTLRIVAAPGVLGNDSDPDGDALTAQLVSGPAHGTLVLSGDGSFTYTPNLNFNGPDGFSYRASDGTATSGVATANITVGPVNDPPDAVDDTASTNENTSVVIDILANDSDVDSALGTLAVSITVAPAHGVAGFDAVTRRATYAPAQGFSGTDSFTYRICDAEPACDNAIVQVTVSDIQHPPTAADDQYAATEDTLRIVAAPGVLGNDSDPDGDALSAQLVSGPAHGTLVLSSDGSFTYTPNLNFNGPDGFSYRASDGTLFSAPATVHIDVAPVNDPPVAQGDLYSIDEDAVLSVGAPGILVNDTDVDGDALTAALVTGPANGTLTLNGDGSFTYTPNVNFSGLDSFTYSASDGAATSPVATVSITIDPVNDAPDAVDDAAATDENTPVTIDVLANDSDVDSGTATVTLTVTVAPTHGTATFDLLTRLVTYTPAPGFSGTDSFTYRICDAEPACDSANVQVTVHHVNHAPVANAGADLSATTGQPVTFDGSASSDPDGDTLTYAWTIVSAPAGSTALLVGANSAAPKLTPDRGGLYRIALVVSDGALFSAPDEVQVNANTPPTVDAGPDGNAVVGVSLDIVASFTDPDAGDSHTASIDWGDGTIAPAVVNEAAKTASASHAYATSGPFTVTVTVTDFAGAFGTDALKVTVSPANRAPTAADDQYAATEDTLRIVAAPGVLGNDSDPDGDALSAQLVSGPAHGTLVLSSDGSFTYTPNLNFNGPDGFSYRASDGTLFSAPATVHIDVAPVNDAPVAQDDSATTVEDTAVQIDVLANDSDVDGTLDPASVAVTVAPTSGTTAVDHTTGRITYTPGANLHGSDSFTYRVCDNGAACDTALVSVEVTAANDPPVANAGPDQTAATGQLVTLSGSGSDPDGDTITYSWTIVSAPPGSTAALSDPLTATPSITPDRVGLYRFELTVSDGTASASDQVDVTVQGVITLTPDPLGLQTNAIGSLTVTLSALAGAGGQLIGLQSTNGAIAAVPSAVLVLEGATSAVFDVTTGTLGGTVQVTASATGFASDSATVNVGERALSLSIQDELVGVGRTTNATVTLSTPAPAGGVVVTLVMADPLKATIAPSTVTIPAGATQGTAVITGVAVGTTTLSASAPGYTNAVANVTVTDALISIGFIPELGPDEVQGVPISLTKPAPPGGLTISLVTAQPGIATVSPTATVPAGGFLPPANPQVTGHTLGTTEITATAPGFAPDHRSVVVAVHLSFTPTTLTLGANTTRDITLHSSASAPVGGLNVSLDTDSHAIATVPALVTIPQGQTSLVVPVTGVNNGTTTLRTTVPGITQTTATIVVGAPISISARTVGKDLQEILQATLTVPAPAGNLPVTFTSADPSRLLISSIQTAGGAASATVSATAGNTFTPSIYLQALAGSGTVQVTASAPGYSDGTMQVTLVPSGFRIFQSPSGGSSFTTTTFSGNTTIGVRSARLNASFQFITDVELRGGLTVDVDVSSSNAAVGVITTSPLHFVGGTGATQNTSFDPISSGVSTISFTTPAGFSTPTTFQTVLATVDAPNVLIFNPTVGKDLQSTVGVSLESAPPVPTDVTVTVMTGGEGIVALSKTQTAAGTSTVTFTGVTTTFAGNIYVQGLEQGTAQLLGTATGYDAANTTVTVVPSGFWIYALPSVTSSFSTTTFAANTQIGIRTSRLGASLQIVADQEVRGGLTLDVDVASSNPAVGVITTSPVHFVGGTGAAKLTTFDPISSGVSTISYTKPAGFSTPTTFQTVIATVDAPDITIGGFGTVTVGRDLQLAVGVSLESAPPAPVDVTVTVVPGGEGFVAISKVQTAAGSNTVTFTGVTSTFAGNIYVQGLTLGSAQLSATAANYNTGAANITVVPSGFWVYALPLVTPSFTTNTFAANTQIGVRSSRLSASSAIVADQEVRGGLTVTVGVTSSLPSVGTITTSPVQFVGGTGAAKTTAFDPQTVGTSIISIPSPVPGFSAPTTFQTVTANVRAPEVRINNGNISSHRIGRDLQVSAAVTLEDAPPEPVNIVLTVVPGGEGIASISKIQNALGTNTVTFTGVTTTFAGNIFIQGRSIGSTQVTGIAAGYQDAVASVSVEPSGFYTYVGSFATAFTTTAGAANTTINVRSAALDPITLNYRTDQEVRGGLTVNVAMTSSNTSVGTVGSPVVFVGGTGVLKTTVFDPASAGTAILSIPTPVPGFFTISNQSAIVTATVNP